jgi:beta-lactam-binding protein with PASTA domain
MLKGVGFPALRILLVSALSAASATLAVAAAPASQPQDNAAAAKTQVAQTYGKIPLSFEANQGQADRTVKFISRGSGYSLFLTDSSAVLALTKQDATNAMPERSAGKGVKPATAQTARKTDVIQMELAGANRATHVAGMDRLPGTANYFIGNDPAQWHSGVPTFAKVQYAGVYPGIDLLYYGNQRQLEYDFVVAPGASPKPIRLQFVGANKLDLANDGDLTVSAANGQIAFHKPVVYQLKDGVRQPIEGQFDLLPSNTVGFTLGRYDHSKPLVIDPVLSYSTYLGGSLSDVAYGIAADSSGNAYVVGTTFSTNFPVTNGAVQPSNDGSAKGVSNVFVAKLNPAGTALVYSTYLGGSGVGSGCCAYGDYGQAIAVDGSGDAYVTGDATSANFPVTSGAYQTTNNSTNISERTNVFVTKLNPTGTALIYSTYLGGNFLDYSSSIAVDSADDAYVAGYTTSSTFPATAGAYQIKNNADIAGGWASVFVTKLNTTGTALLYSTYLGGTGYGARGAGIAVDSFGDAYVTGNALTIDFPTTNGAFQTLNKAAAAVNANPTAYSGNVFVTKLNPTGAALVYSTFVGGSTDDYGLGIALDGSGDAYVTGSTNSSDFPVVNAYQSTNPGSANKAPSAFVTEVNSAGTGLVYSTYLGGSGIPPQACSSACLNQSGSGDVGVAIAVDDLGDAYVTGNAVSLNFPTTSGAYQTVNNAAALYQSTGTNGVNAFVTKLNPSGSQLLYSTYLGGSNQDSSNGIAQDGVGGIYVAGEATSTNFPTTTGAYQATNAGGVSDAFIAKLAIGPVGGQVAVPNVVGDTQAAATTAITGAGLVLGTVTTQSSSTVASGDVISESPVAGTSVSNGSAVNIVVSTGPAQVAVPNVVGDTKAAATTAITGAGLVLGTVSTASSSTVASGNVISESPVAGTSVSTGSAVNIVVSTGPAPVVVPNVVGDTQAAATTAITGAGLVLGTVTTQSSSAVASGDVISESPVAGTSVSTGSAVNLVVSTGAAQVALPNVVGDTQAAATSAIIAAGLAVGTVSTASSSTVASGNVISESPSAGTSVSTGSAVNLVVSTGPAQTPSYTLIANPSSLTIKSGSSASTVITLTPTGGFTGTVNFTCGTLPADVTCTFMPTSLTVTSSTALTTTLTIGTTGTATAALIKQPAGTVLPTLLAALILLPLGFTRRILRTRKTGSQWFGLLLLTGACFAAAGLLGTAGCGGSSSSTPAGTYSIPITVTSGSTTVPLNLSITIQ